MRIGIVGAGASGLMCAGIISKYGHEVMVFDGNEKPGKKIYITGKGRCNFTNACVGDEFSTNIVRGGKFLFSALYRWNSFDTIDFFEKQGIPTKIERGGRAFPQSDKASDITKALLKNCDKVKFIQQEKVVAIDKKEKFIVITEKNKYECDKVIVATGGKSYPATGSCGDGYKFARRFGHTIIEPRPALVPIELKDEFIKELQGLSLKNVSIKCIADGKRIDNFGEMLFTDKGISGPIVLSLSSQINRASDIKLSLDFKPALDDKKLDERLIRDFEVNKNRTLGNVLKLLLPHAIIPIFLNKCGIDSLRKANSITVEEREKMIKNLKNFSMQFKELYPVETGIVTSGGVDTKEINPKNMESKFVEGLYFIGEVLDIDAFTGGFNLQIAFATATACGESFK